MKGFLNDLNFKMSNNLVTHLHEKNSISNSHYFSYTKMHNVSFSVEKNETMLNSISIYYTL